MSDGHVPRPPDDPTGIEEPHDVLAAEEFAMPARSAGDLPPDPTGIREPHDVLAAEEFAMPAPGVPEADSPAFDPRSLIPGLVVLALAALALRRLRA
jgi:hypothetical protein